MSRKFFGTSAATHLTVENESPSRKTLTFITISRQMHTRMDSALARWKIISTPTTSMFSPIRLVGYFSNLVRIHGSLTTSGKRIIFLFLKVSAWLFLLLSPVANIFSGICGKLEGERIVGNLFRNRPCEWCHVESLPQALPSQPQAQSAVHFPNPLSTKTRSSATGTPAWISLNDWRVPISHVLYSQDIKQDTKIRIRILPNGTPSRL